MGIWHLNLCGSQIWPMGHWKDQLRTRKSRLAWTGTVSSTAKACVHRFQGKIPRNHESTNLIPDIGVMWFVSFQHPWTNSFRWWHRELEKIQVIGLLGLVSRKIYRKPHSLWEKPGLPADFPLNHPNDQGESQMLPEILSRWPLSSSTVFQVQDI